jgi:hypothetical protein
LHVASTIAEEIKKKYSAKNKTEIFMTTAVLKTYEVREQSKGNFIKTFERITTQ